MRVFFLVVCLFLSNVARAEFLGHEPAVKQCFSDLGGCLYWTHDEYLRDTLVVEASIYDRVSANVKADFAQAGFRVMRAESNDIARLETLVRSSETTNLDEAKANMDEKYEDYMYSAAACLTGASLCTAAGVFSKTPAEYFVTGLTCLGTIAVCAQTKTLIDRYLTAAKKYHIEIDKLEAKGTDGAPPDSEGPIIGPEAPAPIFSPVIGGHESKPAEFEIILEETQPDGSGPKLN